MVVIPDGRSVVGSLRREFLRNAHEGPPDGPQREVTLRTPLAVGKHEVTLRQFAAFQRATGRDMGQSCGIHRRQSEAVSEWRLEVGKSWSSPGFVQTDEHPVVCVSWDDAQAYVRWLSERTGQRYRLLTEAEWEYAARAGTTTQYSFGSTIDQTQANIHGIVGRTQPVGSYPQNDWGLHDMHGNVSEWVEDCYREDDRGLAGDASQTVNQANCRLRRSRGGNWNDIAQFQRSAFRGHGTRPGTRSNGLGFRVARTPGG
jgi:formylglycine-generating enzyme required for sulfatase activity